MTLAESFTSVAACSFPAAVTTRVMGPRRALTAWMASGAGGLGRRETTVTAATATRKSTARIRIGQLIRWRGASGARAGEAAGSAGRSSAGEGCWAGSWDI